MKRWGLFFSIFLVLFILTFFLSLLLSPNWVSQQEWPKALSRNIVIGGLVMIGEVLVSYVLSLILEDNELKERIFFYIGDKYKIISTKLDEFTKDGIDKEKQSRKYIPDIFVESTSIKEKLRYYCEPFLFFEKIVENSEQKIQSAFIIDLLNQIHYPLNKKDRLIKREQISSIEQLLQNIQIFKKSIDQEKDILELLKTNQEELKTELLSKIPSNYAHIYNYVYPNLQFSYSLEKIIRRTEEDLDLLVNKVLILKGLAGHGKTNLLCDFTETFLLRKKHKCIYLPARALNYIGEQETIEQLFSRILFSESGFQFSDLLRLLKFDKSIDFLFIIIDGINEHRDSKLFSVALEQFIQRSYDNRIKIILSCRSEYFDDRFGNLLNLKGSSIIDMDSRVYVQEVPDVHQYALISKYFSEFNIQLDPNRVRSEISRQFYEDKLLLRIFSEAYENDRPTDYLSDLYKLEIFNKYLEKKLEVESGLDVFLAEITARMIKNEEFNNFPLSSLSQQSIEVIEHIVYENIVIRKDIINIPGVAFGKYEVINFVYDEFRDFLLASEMIVNWKTNSSLAKEQIRQLTRSRLSVSEGIQKYLCLWGIKNDQKDLITFLTSLSWFDLVFSKAVFNSPDRYHTDFIIEGLKKLFRSNPISCFIIIISLLSRTNTERYPSLNIDLLLEWMNEVDEVRYREIITVALNNEEDYKTSYINLISEKIYSAFQENTVSEILAHKLIRLLGYFSGIKDSKYPNYRNDGFGQYPAYDAIIMISNLVEKSVVLEEIRLLFRYYRIEPVKFNLQSVINHLGGDKCF